MVDVCDTAKVRFFKQITTYIRGWRWYKMMFVILQKYDFSSKSQPFWSYHKDKFRCLWYCKSTIFQANHNRKRVSKLNIPDVCDTAKVRFFKQITTRQELQDDQYSMFVILQKYDFSSKSQRNVRPFRLPLWCLWYCKSTIFQANHNNNLRYVNKGSDVCDTAKVRFFKQITT